MGIRNNILGIIHKQIRSFVIFPRAWIAWIVCLASLQAQAEPHFISIQGLPAFADARTQLQALADTNGHQPATHFCIVGQKDGRYVQAFVSWPAENALILWMPQHYNPRVLVQSRRYWHLDRDVVAGDDTYGSTFLLTRSFVTNVLTACRRLGVNFAVDRSPGAGPPRE